MRQQGKKRSRNADDEPIIQLTRGQMVLAVCGLLIGALIFYLLGVLTSHLEPRFSKDQGREQVSHVLPAPEVPGPSTPAKETKQKSQRPREGVQASPRTDVLPTDPEKHDSTSPPETPPNDDGPPLNRVPAPAEASDTSEPAAEETLEHATRAEKSTPANKPKRVELSPKSETEKSADSATGKPKKKPETTESENNKSEVRTESTAGDSNQETQTKTEPSEQPERDTELAIDKIDLPPDNLPAASPPKGDGKPFYSIQLIAFSKANRDKAKAYAKEVRESAGLDVEVEDSSNGEYVRVFVGRYADRASALRACRELQKQEQFSKVFVPQHPRGGKNTP